MKILVFSDTHGDVSAMYDIISGHRYDTDLVIHLGDHIRDLESVMLDFLQIAHIGVIGNCDFSFMSQNVKYEGAFTAHYGRSVRVGKLNKQSEAGARKGRLPRTLVPAVDSAQLRRLYGMPKGVSLFGRVLRDRAPESYSSNKDSTFSFALYSSLRG